MVQMDHETSSGNNGNASDGEIPFKIFPSSRVKQKLPEIGFYSFEI